MEFLKINYVFSVVIQHLCRIHGIFKFKRAFTLILEAQ